nr:hypothetical protein [Tanacetum cinerariifolium]
MSDNIPFDLQIEIIKKVSDVKSLVRFRYICLLDDDNIETFKVQQQFAPFVVSPLLKQYNVYNVVGACHGLVCMLGSHYGYMERMLVIWNPSIGKSFGLPDSLKNELYGYVCVSKLRESLVVYGSNYVDRAECCDVWVMERDASFKKLFTIGAPIYYILGFRKSGEPILETKGNVLYRCLIACVINDEQAF